MFTNHKTKKLYKEGEIIKRKKLAAALEVIAKYGEKALYNGVLTKEFINDIKKEKGILTVNDMKHYKPLWEKSISAKLQNNQTLYTAALPSSGVILTFILNILNGFLNLEHLDTVENWHKIVESFKFGYGKRTELGDPEFAPEVKALTESLISPLFAETNRKNISLKQTYQDPKYYGANVTVAEDHGTANLCVLAANGDAVAVTSTINLNFGAGIISRSTGIILNDQMDDFSAPNITNAYGIPPSPSNYIYPGKRPVSSMSPSIIVDKYGDVVLVIGAAGGSKITTSVAVVIIRVLWYGESIRAAVRASRLHHQLFPMHVDFEYDFDKKIEQGLSELGHELHIQQEPPNGFTALTAIGKIKGTIEGSPDPRRGGAVALIK